MHKMTDEGVFFYCWLNSQDPHQIKCVADEYARVIENIMPVHSIALSRPRYAAEVVSFRQDREFCC